MKLLYINKINTNAGWGLETFLNKSLRENGIETICVDYQENAYTLAKSLLNITEDFDAVLLQRGCGYLIPLEILTAINRPKFLIFTELVSRNPNQHYLLKSPSFEHIFFRSLPCIDTALAKGWRERARMSLFLSAIDPSFHVPINNSMKNIDILFVGTLLPRRKEIIAELATNFSIETANVFGREMVELINRAKIILNIHGEDFLDTETRVYETLACKGFLITEILSAENPFRSGNDLIEVANLSEFKAKIAYYLENSIERERIANSGYLEAVRNHSFAKRAKQIQQLITDRILLESPENPPFDRQKLQYCQSWERSTKTIDTLKSNSRRLLSSFKQKLISR
jgi:Glycosyl transferases group 1